MSVFLKYLTVFRVKSRELLCD